MDPTTASDREKIKTNIRKRFSKHCQDLKDGHKQQILPDGQIFHQIKSFCELQGHKRAARTQPGEISVFNLPYKVLNPSR